MPWKPIARKCKQKSTGKTGSHVVVKVKKGGGTEQESCHTSKEKAQAAIRARYANETDVNEEEVLREWVRFVLRESAPDNVFLIQETVTLSINGEPITVELANTDNKRAIGLSGRKSVGSDEGMLFQFDSPKNQYFWMKDTYIPLSIAFIDETNSITAIKSMEPLSEKSVCSDGPALYALEMPEGWFQKMNVSVGDKVHVGA